MSKFHTRRLCYIAAMAALSFLLNMIEIKLPGNLKITFDSLPIVVGALLFGPVDAVLAAVIGEIFTQLLSPYGLTATTALWLIPPALRGLVIGFASLACARRSRALDQRPVQLFCVCILASAVTTAANTAVLWLDSILMDYYSFAMVFGSATIRFATGMITAVAIAVVSAPVVQLLRKQGVAEGWRTHDGTRGY